MLRGAERERSRAAGVYHLTKAALPDWSYCLLLHFIRGLCTPTVDYRRWTKDARLRLTREGVKATRPSERLTADNDQQKQRVK